MIMFHCLVLTFAASSGLALMVISISLKTWRCSVGFRASENLRTSETSGTGKDAKVFQYIFRETWSLSSWTEDGSSDSVSARILKTSLDMLWICEELSLHHPSIINQLIIIQIHENLSASLSAPPSSFSSAFGATGPNSPVTAVDIPWNHFSTTLPITKMVHLATFMVPWEQLLVSCFWAWQGWLEQGPVQVDLEHLDLCLAWGIFFMKFGWSRRFSRVLTWGFIVVSKNVNNFPYHFRRLSENKYRQIIWLGSRLTESSFWLQRCLFWRRWGAASDFLGCCDHLYL